MPSQTVDPHDELKEFLSVFQIIYPNLNDTFGYACADTQRLALDEDTNTDMLVDVWRRFGVAGIWAYCATIRHQGVLKPLRSLKYEQAMDYLADAGWKYEED